MYTFAHHINTLLDVVYTVCYFSAISLPHQKSAGAGSISIISRSRIINTIGEFSCCIRPSEKPKRIKSR